ncbi:restriction endonuclease subunit S [Aliarcobacter cryaerophilus]|uniref:restriction endonuclease subunit S n=1 Tax=Aliarcobacter cryaerophilus TaxID=28198 RepID=UPI0015E86F94|nr:restriction endonuclease subunit S [Aliarcobacter cryaerophilus]
MAELYSLPDGWEWKKLENISKKIFAGGDKPDKVSEFKTDELNIPIYANAVKNNGLYGYSNIYKVDEECITISARGTIGFTVVRNEKFFPIVRLIVLIPNEQVLSKILKYYLDYELVENTGSSIPQLTVPTVKELFFPLPPLEEQKRIVAKLDNLFAKIDKAIALHQKNIDEADIFMASVLNDVFVELEEKYEKYRLEDLTSLITKGTTPTTNGYKFQDSGINFLKIENIVNGEIDLSTIEMFISEEAHQSQKRSQLEINDVLFSIAGTIGDTAIVKKEHLPMNTNQAIALIRPIEKLNSEFLRRLLSSSISNETTNKQRGGAIKNVSLGDIKELELPLPPLETQQKIVAYLDEISQKMEKIKQIQKEKMQSLKELKASILDKAFKGEL